MARLGLPTFGIREVERGERLCPKAGLFFLQKRVGLECMNYNIADDDAKC